MSDSDKGKVRKLPENIDVYLIAEDGSISVGPGLTPDVFLEENASGKLFDTDIALYIRTNYGKVVGVMRDSKFSASPKPYRTRKMILGKTNLP